MFINFCIFTQPQFGLTWHYFRHIAKPSDVSGKLTETP
jgi:hypothetical protein